MSISAGGYVRSVAHELGQDLGCGAHLSSLRRTQAGVFSLTEAHTVEELEALAGNDEALMSLCCASAQFVAGDAGGDRRRDGVGPAAQWSSGESAGVFTGGAGESVCGTTRASGDCEACCGNAVSAGCCVGVRKAWYRDQGTAHRRLLFQEGL